MTRLGFALGLIFALAAHFGTCRAAKILVIPNPSLSHVRFTSAFASALVERGHEVFGIMNEGCANCVKALEKAGVKVLLFHQENYFCFSETGDSFTKTIFTETGTVDLSDSMPEQSAAFATDADALFNNKTLFAELAALKIDLCMLDGFILTLYNYLVPYKLGIPYINLVTDFVPHFAGVPALPSFTPAMNQVFSDRMSFLERVQSTINYFMVSNIVFSLPGSMDSLVEKYAPEKPKVPFLTLMKRAKLWLLNHDIVFDYPRATLPHIIDIGGWSAQLTKPLPENFQKLMDNAKNGAVILTFGSLAKDLPEILFIKMFQAFDHFKDITFIVKYNGAGLKNIPSHVHVFKWIPQNDLLGHPSMKLFVTHAGGNGQAESVLQGVPMLAFPLFGDQFYNAKRVAVKGFGLQLDAFQFKVEEMVDSIREILTNDSYNAAVEHAAKIFKSYHQTPLERAVYWIEHIINFGSDHLISSATELPWYQYYCIDVLLFLTSIFVAVVVMICVVLKVCYRMLCSGTTKAKKA